MTSYLIGIALVLVAYFMAIPVAVNFPDSWLGALLALALLLTGGLAMRHGARRRREPD